MDINKYIIDSSSGNKLPMSNDVRLNQIQFKIVLGLDVNDTHIPKWFKDKRVMALIDHCINEGIIDKNRILYRFSFRFDPHNIKFISFKIMELSLDELNSLSHILPAPDLIEYVKFKPSEPYHASKFTVSEPPKNNNEINKSKIKTFYDLTCTIDRIETSIGTILVN